ncbi:hypothetical protein [Cellulomonas hominis]
MHSHCSRGATGRAGERAPARTEEPTNRRFRVLSLTPAGREARRLAIEAFTAASPVSRLDRRDQAELVRILGLVLAPAAPGRA